ncbi:MAG TPA: hypothetical protein VN690_02505 [Terriglobales bacterium]|nr:hypothetical protein [Terriglobales bacterium]
MRTRILMLALSASVGLAAQQAPRRGVRAPNARTKVQLSPKLPLSGGVRAPSAMELALTEQAAQARAERGAMPAGMVAGGGSGGGALLGSGSGGGTLLGGGGTPGTPGSGTPPAGTGMAGPGAGTRRVSVAPMKPTLTPRASVPPAGSSSSGASKLAAKSSGMTTVPCMLATSAPSIYMVSGKKTGIVFTPNVGSGPNPTNVYTIRGCHFGAVQGQGHVQIVGNFLHHAGPVRMPVDSWSDQMIVAVFDPSFQDEYDTANITLAVTAANGQTAQLAGNSFYAARASRPLTYIPKSAFGKVGAYPFVPQTLIVSAASKGNLTMATRGVMAPDAASEQWTAYVEHEVGLNDYPNDPLQWSEAVEFKGLRAGFVLDPSYQVALDGFQIFDMNDCKFNPQPATAQLENTTLQLTEHPAVCDSFGKYAFAGYGLILTVTGPKGADLSPWPDGMN